MQGHNLTIGADVKVNIELGGVMLSEFFASAMENPLQLQLTLIQNVGNGNELDLTTLIAQTYLFVTEESEGLGDDYKGLAGTDLSKYASSCSWTLNNGNLIFSGVLTIPEPSSFGLLAGLGAIALAVSRRRRTRR